jgi:CheY-like chemotaxis protein
MSDDHVETQEAAPAGTGRILMVDDEGGFLYSASKALRQAGFDVVATDSYQHALDLLQKDERIDLLVTDIVMPRGINGFALARMANMRRLDLKVLYLTAFDVPTHEAVGKVLKKPVSEDELIREVKLALAT